MLGKTERSVEVPNRLERLGGSNIKRLFSIWDFTTCRTAAKTTRASKYCEDFRKDGRNLLRSFQTGFLLRAERSRRFPARRRTRFPPGVTRSNFCRIHTMSTTVGSTSILAAKESMRRYDGHCRCTKHCNITLVHLFSHSFED